MCYSCSIHMLHACTRERSLRVCTILLASAIALSAQTAIQPGTLPSDLGKDDFPFATPVEVALPGAPALDLKGKANYYLKSISSTESIGRMVLTTGVGGNAEGRSFAQTFAGRYAEHVTKRTVQFGISALRGEDPRFRRSGKDGIWARTAFVLSRSVLTDMDNGGTSIAAGRLVGSFAGNTLSAYWDPTRPDPLKHGLTGTGINLASDAGVRMLREFWPDVKSMFKH
jgi:hypothetical protein